MVLIPPRELFDFKYFTVQIQKTADTIDVFTVTRYEDIEFIASCYCDWHLFFDITTVGSQYTNLTITPRNLDKQYLTGGLVRIRHASNLFYRQPDNETLFLLAGEEDYGLVVEQRHYEPGFEVKDNPDSGFHSSDWYEWVVLFESTLVRFPAPYLGIHYHMEVVDPVTRLTKPI